MATALMSVSGCASSMGTTGIEAPAGKGVTARLSLCELVDRDQLTYSRRDTEETKDNLGAVLEVYDANCPRAGA